MACGKKEAPAPEASPAQAATAPIPAPPAAPAPTDAAGIVDQMRLQTLGAVKVPADNPQTDAKVKLGQQLFFDTRLSVDGSRACYSCHQNEQGTGGEAPTAIGAKNKQLTRHSPMLWNVGHLPALYWDGRADSLEAVAKGAWAGGNMGVGKENLDKKAAEIGDISGYEKQFSDVFGDKGATAETVAQALAAYMRTLECKDTAFDQYAAGNKGALDHEQKLGLSLFMGEAGCVTCHAPPMFTTAAMGTGAFFNTGVGIEGKNEKGVDIGRKEVTKNDADFAAFKPPSLRNVTKTAPYFHDGSAKTLAEAVRFMATGGYDNPHKSPLLRKTQLSDEQVMHIIAFLGSLQCKGQLEKPELPK